MTTLWFERRIIAQCESGLLRVEHVLFPSTSAPERAGKDGIVTLRTTAHEARARLESIGIGRVLLDDVSHVVGPELVAAFGRTAAIRRLGRRLGPAEIFDGATYEPKAQSYPGRWVDLPALSMALGLRGAGHAFQAIFLAASLADLEPHVPVELETTASTEGGGQPLRFPEARRVSLALRSMRPRAPSTGVEGRPVWDEELAKKVRDARFGRVIPAARARLAAIEVGLAEIDMPAVGPLARPDLWALQRQLDSNDGRQSDEQIDALEQSYGNVEAVRYLREYASFVRGLDPPRKIAERLSKVSGGPRFFERDLLEVRAWLMSGMPGYARHCARALLESPDVPPQVRAAASLILETSPVSQHGEHAVVAPSPIVVVKEIEPPRPVLPPALPARRDPQPLAHPRIPRPAPRPRPAVVAEAEVEPDEVEWDQIILDAQFDEPSQVPPPAYASSPSEFPSTPPPARDSYPDTPRAAHVPPMDAALERGLMTVPPPMPPPPAPTRSAYPPRGEGAPRDGMVVNAHAWAPVPVRPSYASGLSFPPAAIPSRAPLSAEHVETLSLPPGATEEMLAPGGVPRSQLEVRIACTRMARELGRSYRKRSGLRLRTDALAVEAMQRHLLSLWPDGKPAGPNAAGELRRHGALMSEILARSLGAEWVDVMPSEIGYWAMFVPPSTRTWPFGRVYRFVTMGRTERDLVAYYLELCERARRST